MATAMKGIRFIPEAQKTLNAGENIQHALYETTQFESTFRYKDNLREELKRICVNL